MRAGRRRVTKRLGTGAPVLRITALMDIFSTLLLFLLKSFVADGQAGTVTPGVTLPSSVARAEVREAPVIAVTKDFISLDGQMMTASSKALEASDLKVSELYDALVNLRDEFSLESDEKPRVVVQGDRGIEFRLLQRVMYTSQLAGYRQVSLAVLQGDGPEEPASGDQGS